MNAPLHRDDRTPSLLQAAISVLEMRYQQQGSACVALLICRYYRLLMHAEPDPVRQKLSRLQAEYWMQIYRHCGQRGKRKSSLPPML